MARRWKVLALALAVCLVSAACGGGDGGGASPPPPGTEDDAPDDFTERGPYEVGVTTYALPTGNEVEVYYPATDEAEGATDSYRVAEYLPEALADVVPEGTEDSYTVEAGREAPASDDGPFPVVLFSHGFSSFRTQSSELLSHLASWGMVAASPDHPARNLVSQLGGGAGEPPEPADDLRATLELLETESGTADGLLEGIVDEERVAAGGHSAGGGTVLEVAADPDVDGYVSYASGRLGGDEGESPTPLPATPSLFLAGALDTVVEPSRTAEAYAEAPAPSWHWVLGEAGHLAFSDLCAIGSGQGGLLGLAEAAGLADAIPDDLRRLATDGCEPPNRPVEEVWPAIHHSSVAFYRYVFEIDDEPVALGPEAAEQFADLDLTIEAKPPA